MACCWAGDQFAYTVWWGTWKTYQNVNNSYRSRWQVLFLTSRGKVAEANYPFPADGWVGRGQPFGCPRQSHVDGTRIHVGQMCFNFSDAALQTASDGGWSDALTVQSVAMGDDIFPESHLTWADLGIPVQRSQTSRKAVWIQPYRGLAYWFTYAPAFPGFPASPREIQSIRSTSLATANYPVDASTTHPPCPVGSVADTLKVRLIDWVNAYGLEPWKVTATGSVAEQVYRAVCTLIREKATLFPITCGAWPATYGQIAFLSSGKQLLTAASDAAPCGGGVPIGSGPLKANYGTDDQYLSALSAALHIPQSKLL
jgi:hypothetical protein